MKKLFKFAFLIPFLLTAAGCNKDPGDPSEPVTPPEDELTCQFDSDDFLTVIGNKVYTKGNTTEEVFLKGVNVGGLFVTEHWMSPYTKNEAMVHSDHKTLTETFVSRFGADKTLDLWDIYREAYWTDDDYIMCKTLGMNVLRLPFTYMTLDPLYNNVRPVEGEKYNFELLDKFIDGAGKHGLYVILDMHGAYGSHNGQDHSGEIVDTAAEVDFYSNEEKMSKTIDMWDAISKRYKDNPTVAAYDLLNEPGEKAGSTTTRHFKFMDRCYDKIRENDDEHIIMFESCWNLSNLPAPSTYGWENCIYQLHHYSWTSVFESHKTSVDNKIKQIEDSKHGVPVYIGEFFCQTNPYSWEYTLRKFNEHKIHYTPWTYKISKPNIGTSLFITRGEPIDPVLSSYEEIVDCFRTLYTFHKDSTPTIFSNGAVLPKIYAETAGGTY